MYDAKVVMLDKYRKMIPRPAKKQKLDRAYSEVVHPRKNATKFVKDVMVIEEPA